MLANILKDKNSYAKLSGTLYAIHRSCHQMLRYLNNFTLTLCKIAIFSVTF